jgi:dTDP-4-dehydrorhamnose reductase/dTDP-4-dehydrorhamnose 3,5-epimerase
VAPSDERHGRHAAARDGCESLEGVVLDTGIPGLQVIDLTVHRDQRGWFKENWQRQRMLEAGLPDFGPVQHNVSFNIEKGVTRGVHAEPWDKLVSVLTGRVFGAWVDLRQGETYGRVFTCELAEDRAVFVPEGVGNAYQTLEADTTYSYLVNDHWSPAARERYIYLNLADETASIPWPIPLSEAVISEADRTHPRLDGVRSFTAKETLILGADGQVGRALRSLLPHAHAVTRQELDLTALDDWDWQSCDVVINAAAYTAVDKAETEQGREAAWAVNATAVGKLARLAREHRFTFVHISSDYVFDGSQSQYDEEAPLAPLGVYGQSKAAGDLAAATAPRHYILRSSWVVGEGANFVRTMADLALRGVRPEVVDDQHGRLTFAGTIAEAVVHLIGTHAEYGVYNVTNDGPVMSWYDVAREVFHVLGRSPDEVTAVTTEDYRRKGPAAPRPARSVLDLTKVKATGYEPPEGLKLLTHFLEREAQPSA